MTHSLWKTILVLAAVPAPLLQAADRDFAVRDSIEMSRFSNVASPNDGELLSYSPNRRFVVAVTTRGIIAKNQLQSTIWLFPVDSVKQYLVTPVRNKAPVPQALASVAAVPSVRGVTAYASVISNLRWSSDSMELYFLAEKTGTGRRLCRVGMLTRKTECLSPERYDVRRFDLSGDSVVFSTWPASNRPDVFGDVINADARAVTGLPIADVLFPQTSIVPKVTELWIRRMGKLRRLRDPKQRAPQSDLNYLEEVFKASPKANAVVVLRPVSPMPSSWRVFHPAPGQANASADSRSPSGATPFALRRVRQYAVVDLRTGVASPLLDGPFADTFGYPGDSRAVWAEDERRLIVTNTFLGPNGTESEISHCAVASVDLPSHRAGCILRDLNINPDSKPEEPLEIQDLRFGRDDDDVLIRVGGYGRPGPVLQFHCGQDGWERIGGIPETPRGDGGGIDFGSIEQNSGGEVSFEVRQALSDPPALWVSNGGNAGRSVRLWDPNRQLGNLRRGSASVFHWKDGSGYEWTGGLVKPAGFVPGRRYPLVIQTHGFSETEFMTDGMFPTAQAAMALASAGIAVLQVRDKPVHTMNSEEAIEYVNGYAAAVDELVSEGLVDPGKVGIVGFSWTCWYVETALIRDPARYQAATIVDGIDNSYLQYHLWGAGSPAIRVQAEQINGGKPTEGEGLDRWIARAPGFHLDRIRTPLRIEAIGPVSVLGEWEIYSSLYLENRPVDLIYISEGQHILQKPLDRLASQQGSVDWFRFWLEGWEDPAEEKRPQYDRWRRLQALRREALQR